MGIFRQRPPFDTIDEAVAYRLDEVKRRQRSDAGMIVPLALYQTTENPDSLNIEGLPDWRTYLKGYSS